MDFQNIDGTSYKPSKCEPVHTTNEVNPIELSKLVTSLRTETADLRQYPYDPECWTRRAVTFTKLGYPELAVGDAYKAGFLCRTLLQYHHERPTYKLGYRMGFWMLDDAAHTVEESERIQEHLAVVQARVHRIKAENQYRYPELDEGRCFYRLYPWMEARHRLRDVKLLAEINQEFDLRSRANGYAPACEVRRHAFSESVNGKDTSDVLGVFATRDIAKSETFLVDETDTWGCTGPGRDGRLPHGALGCVNPLHPNLPSEDTTLDLRWVRDRAGGMAGEVLLRVRCLLRCVQNVAHPLDDAVVARLTPHYGSDRKHKFYVEEDIAISNDALSQFGIDIFANLNYDTWVLFTLRARISNNSWSNPIHVSIHPLFSLFNHSCAANVDWTCTINKLSMAMNAKQSIRCGEQMFVEYDSYISEQPLPLRRARLMNWLAAPCQCTRCLREETRTTEVVDDFRGRHADWDDEERPVFPEDHRH